MAVNLKQIPRADKRDIARKVADNLIARKAQGEAEPALDAYIPELEESHTALDEHVEGNVIADAARTAQLAALDEADIDVDTFYRHVECYIAVEAGRRAGPNVDRAIALHGAAFPDGLAHVDDPIADENRLCRDSLTVLRSAEHASTVTAIDLPPAWLTKWEAALDASDAALDAVEKARQTRRVHVDLGRDAELDWVETMVRLRKYIGSRARRTDTTRINEGKTLLAPLTTFLARLEANAAARATRRRNAENDQPPPATPPTTSQPT